MTDETSTPNPTTGAKVTVNLTAQATEALDGVVALTRGTQTDAISRALHTYAHLEQKQHEGCRFYIEYPNGNSERVELT